MHYGVAMRNHGKIIPELCKVRRTVTLSKPAKQRLKWMEFYASHGKNARLTCRHFGLSPDVFYRWKKRYRPGHLVTLEDTTSRRPRTVRQPHTEPLLVARVKALREQYPRWGKKKLYVMVTREGFSTSESTVGRILGRLRTQGRLIEPVSRSPNNEHLVFNNLRSGVRRRKPPDSCLKLSECGWCCSNGSAGQWLHGAVVYPGSGLSYQSPA